MLRRFYSTNRNRFSSRNGRENSSSVYGQTRCGQLYFSEKYGWVQKKFLTKPDMKMQKFVGDFDFGLCIHCCYLMQILKLLRKIGLQVWIWPPSATRPPCSWDLLRTCWSDLFNYHVYISLAKSKSFVFMKYKGCHWKKISFGEFPNFGKSLKHVTEILSTLSLVNSL